MQIRLKIQKGKILCTIAFFVLLFLVKRTSFSPGLAVVLAMAMLGIQCVSIAFSKKIFGIAWDLTFTVGMAFATIFLTQYLLEAPSISLGTQKVFLGALACFLLILVFICITNKVVFSVIISTGICMLLATADYYVYIFRGNEIFIHDFLGIQTALNVAGNYSLIPSHRMIIAWCCWLLLVAFALSIRKEGNYHIYRLITLLALVILSAIFYYSTKDIVIKRWHNVGRNTNGFILNFSLDIRNLRMKAPADYSKDKAERLLQKYNYDEDNSESEYPDAVIVIMNESLSDFAVYGDNYRASKDVLSFYHSLNDNSIKGYALSSVFGGTTANSEFEFLTGNTMNFLPFGSVPYMQYVNNNTWSLVSWFNELGYKTIGMHPYLANGWNRDVVYPYLGFDEIMFLEDFPQKDLIRGLVSDRELYEKIVQNVGVDDDKIFVFAVTMQNHGDYGLNGWEEFTDWEIEIDGFPDLSPDVRDFLTLTEISDAALRDLINSLEEFDKKIVLLVFGDHQPSVDERFYSRLVEGRDDSLDTQQLNYMIPFLIWANYDIKEEYIPCTSINYLADYLLENAKIRKPAYFHFLNEVQDIVPAINSNGYYSTKEEKYIPVDYAKDEEKRILEQYHTIEYSFMIEKN